jgi:hypothetical protein
MNERRRRVVALTTIGILAAATMVACGWWLGQRGDDQPAASGVTTVPSTSPRVTSPPATGGPTPTTTTQKVGTWQRLPAAPIPTATYEFDRVSTGRELLLNGAVHDGKGGLRAAGAAYNPATRTWRKLPPGPDPAEAMEGGYTAVWTGTEMLGWGLGLNAAYNPATNRWRRVSGPFGGSVWTGRQALTWGGGCCGSASAEGGAYNPATDTWQRLPRSPLAGRHPVMAWTGTELVIAGGNDADGRIFRDAAAYNPTTRSWRRLPPLPAPRTGATATWTGTEVLVVGGHHGGIDKGGLYADGLAYNPAINRWRRLPAMEVGRVAHPAVWTGRQLLVWGGQTVRAGVRTAPTHGLAYDPAANRWSAPPTAPLRGRTGHLAVWTGSQMLIWGGGPARETDPQRAFADGAAYTPSGV